VTVHAIRIHAYGGPEMMRWEAVPAPVAGHGEVVVAVRAASVNPVDWKTRDGLRRGRSTLELPATLGCDLAGVVEQVGPGVKALQVGQPVFGMTGLNGAFAEFVALPAAYLAPKPANLNFNQAAAVPLAALTAWQALNMAGLTRGQRILVHAAAGGVGSFAVQLARCLGAAVVATTSAANIEFVRSLGAAEAVDYQAEPFEKVVAPVDVVLDLLGGDTQARSWQLLKPGGFLVTTVAVDDGKRSEDVRAARVGVTANGGQLAEIGRLIEAGQVRVEVARTVAMSNAAEALEANRAGRTRGKIVLTVG
jgi:NADPH:quinone reductase-like Zn-dependent oxidoreductase